MTKPTLKRRQHNSTLPARTQRMQRTAAIQASGSSSPKGRKPLAKRNAKRREREFARCYGSVERVEFVKSRGCYVGRRLGGIDRLLGAPACSPVIDNAHTEHDGIGRKAHYSTIAPLCRKHHRDYDERRWPLNMHGWREQIRREAAATEAAWRRHLAAVGPISEPSGAE